jgi:RNA polymerase sigma factor (sigma-70 family)
MPPISPHLKDPARPALSPRFSPSELFLRAQTDERLAALASDGHGRAFAVLIERHRRQLMAHARRLVGDQRGEDVVQDALLRAWRSLERGAEVRHVQAWLHRIVHNAALSDIERQARQPEPLYEQVVDRRSTAADAEHRLQVREVLVGVSALPERQRLALLGMELEGRSRRQLAAELGLSEGAVRQLVSRARDGVRAAMAAFVPFPLVTRFMKASGWIGSTDGSAALHPAAEATAISGIAAGAALKAGAAVLAVGALGGGLLLHGENARQRPRPTEVPPVTTQRNAGPHLVGHVAAASTIPVVIAAAASPNRARQTVRAPSPADAVTPRAAPEPTVSVPQPRRQPTSGPGRNLARPVPAQSTGSAKASTTESASPEPTTPEPTDTASSPSGDSQPAATTSVSGGDGSSQSSSDSGSTPTLSDSSNRQSAPDEVVPGSVEVEAAVLPPSSAPVGSV